MEVKINKEEMLPVKIFLCGEWYFFSEKAAIELRDKLIIGLTTSSAQNQSAQKENDHVKSNNLHINDSAQFAQEKKE